VTITGQSHGRVVAALSAPEILSAGEPAMAASVFGAIRQQEQNHKSAPRRFSADDDQTAREIVADQFVHYLG